MLSTMWSFLEDNSAGVIALSALCFTAYQTYATRKHNKLSVKPHLSEFTDRSHNSTEGKLKFSVSNNGLGPAEITKWKVLLNSVELKFTEHSSVENVIKNTLNGRKFGFTVGTLAIGYVMPANETKDILFIHCAIKDEDDFKEIEKSLNKLDLIIEYKSMYGKTFKLDTRNNSE